MTRTLRFRLGSARVILFDGGRSAVGIGLSLTAFCPAGMGMGMQNSHQRPKTGDKVLTDS